MKTIVLSTRVNAIGYSACLQTDIALYTCVGSLPLPSGLNVCVVNGLVALPERSGQFDSKIPSTTSHAPRRTPTTWYRRQAGVRSTGPALRPHLRPPQTTTPRPTSITNDNLRHSYIHRWRMFCGYFFTILHTLNLCCCCAPLPHSHAHPGPRPALPTDRVESPLLQPGRGAVGPTLLRRWVLSKYGAYSATYLVPEGKCE